MTKIQRLHASISAFPRTRISIDLMNNQKIRYKNGLITEETLDVSDQELNDFMSKIANIPFLTWKSNYNDSSILDGMQWSFSIQTENFRFKTNGSNDFPPSDQFDVLVAAIQELVQREFF
jgi:hypothetical protein